MKLFILLFSFGLSANYDYIYIHHHNPASFYNQTADPAQERIAGFFNAKHEAYQAVVTSAAIPAGLLFCTWLYLKYYPRSGEATPVAAAGMGILGYFLSTTLAGVIQTLTQPYTFQVQEALSGLIESFKRLFRGPLQDEVLALELKYLEKKPLFQSDAQKIIERNFIQLRSKKPPAQGQFLSPQHREDTNLVFIRRALNLPLESKPIIFDSAKFSEEFKQYDGMMSQNPKRELERFAHTLVRASKQNNHKLKAALYLEGPPGVGKTESVTKMAQALNLPLIQIKLGDFEKVSDLKGIPCEYAEDNRCHPGYLAKQLMALSQKNALCYFDEADLVLNDERGKQFVAFMLEFLEGATKWIDNPYFGFDINIEDLGIVLAGNSLLRSTPLRTRLSHISFGNYTEDYRVKAGRERLIPKILDSYEGALTIQDLTEEDWRQIDKISRAQTDSNFRAQEEALKIFVHQKVTICYHF